MLACLYGRPQRQANSRSCGKCAVLNLNKGYSEACNILLRFDRTVEIDQNLVIQLTSGPIIGTKNDKGLVKLMNGVIVLGRFQQLLFASELNTRSLLRVVVSHKNTEFAVQEFR